MNRDKFVRRLTEVEGELAALQRQAQPADDQTCVELLGRTLDELDYDELDRVMQLLREAPDYACPLLLRACLARPEDREHTKPPVPDGRHCHDENPELPLEDPRWWPFDTPEWRAYKTWQRRRWGYSTAANDPEAQALCAWIDAWAVSPDRAYLRGADLRLLFAPLGVEWEDMRYFELQRLVDLCAALDELAHVQPGLEVPLEVFWAVLGWSEHHPERHRSVPGFAQARIGAIAAWLEGGA